MYDHLCVVTVPVDDADVLDQLETGVLNALDPLLNLAKMAKTTIRVRLTELRSLHGTKKAPTGGAPSDTLATNREDAG